MCAIAWFLAAAIVVFAIPVKWWLNEVRRRDKLSQEVCDRAEAIEAYARCVAADIRSQARKERDQWKVAKMLSDAAKGSQK